MVRCVPHYLKLLSAFVEDLPEHFNPKRILDLGCGNGNVTFEMIQKFPDSQYVLLDASQEMIDLCRRRFQGYDIEYVTSYFKDYQFETNKFDLVTAGFSLHHCDADEKQQIFRRISESLKAGGIFGCSDLMIDRAHPEHIQFKKEWELFVKANYPDAEKWEWLMEHYNEYDKPDALNRQIKWLEETGFNTIRKTVLGSYWTYLSAVKK
jgi:ubiquinone/menaquinone biosynthesis C-methylase UbiE